MGNFLNCRDKPPDLTYILNSDYDKNKGGKKISETEHRILSLLFKTLLEKANDIDDKAKIIRLNFNNHDSLKTAIESDVSFETFATFKCPPYIFFKLKKERDEYLLKNPNSKSIITVDDNDNSNSESSEQSELDCSLNSDTDTDDENDNTNNLISNNNNKNNIISGNTNNNNNLIINNNSSSSSNNTSSNNKNKNKVLSFNNDKDDNIIVDFDESKYSKFLNCKDVYHLKKQHRKTLIEKDVESCLFLSYISKQHSDHYEFTVEYIIPIKIAEYIKSIRKKNNQNENQNK